MQPPMDITNDQLAVINTFLRQADLLGQEGYTVEDIVIGFNLACAGYLDQIMEAIREEDEDEDDEFQID